MITSLVFLRLVYTLFRHLGIHFTVPLNYIKLFAGGGANKSEYLNGAFVFDLNCDLSYGIFVNGSAKKDRKLTKKINRISYQFKHILYLWMYKDKGR